MLRQIRADEQGFTLIELLVVILIVGLLAAIAMPTFLGQRAKGEDASAKSDVRNAMTHIESCFLDEQSYDNCGAGRAAWWRAQTGLVVTTTVPDAGEVRIVTDGTAGYRLVARSQSGNLFRIIKTGASPALTSSSASSAPTISRTCETAGQGGCRSNGSW